MGWFVRILGVVILLLGAAFWWLLFADSNAPATSPEPLNMEQLRRLSDQMTGDKPVSIKVIETGSDKAPAFATMAGRLSGQSELSYNAFEILFPEGSIVVGGAIDQQTSAFMKQSDEAWRFDAESYDELLAAILRSEQTLMTHEHLDHVMAIVRHPQPELVAPKLTLNAPQIRGLPQFADGPYPEAYQTLKPKLTGTIEAIAPGVLVVPAAGHTPGSQMIFVSLQDGTEILLIGDIVWMMNGIFELTSRPVITQFVVFDPNEDRTAVKDQIRAIHDLIAENPDLIVLPAHDRLWLKSQSLKKAINWPDDQ